MNEIKQLGGNAMAIHASVEEADAIVDQIMGKVTTISLKFTFKANYFF